jgi:hypothetical protein
MKFIVIYILEADMGHQGVQALCLKHVRFAYNYAYPRIYIPKIRMPNSYIPKICIPKIYIPGIHLPNIYLSRLHIYIYTYFLHAQGIYAKKNTIPRVYIPHSCLLGMWKSYIPWSMYKTSHILYVLSMVPRHLGALVILHIYFCSIYLILH